MRVVVLCSSTQQLASDLRFLPTESAGPTWHVQEPWGHKVLDTTSRDDCACTLVEQL